MSDEQFLARWSRRKQEARADRAEPTPEKAAEAHDAAPADRAAVDVAEPVPLETELLNLPPIESIDAVTDVRAYLRKGVPRELSRAALRRAWSADPAIRDFVGLAENAWDFNDPTAMAGFGPLDYSAEQVDALVRRIVGSVAETAESPPNPLSAAAEDSARSAHSEAGFAQPSNPVKATTEPEPSESAASELPSGSAASQPETADETADDETPLPHRTHGGALPR
jgi:hypothetical protein